MSKATPAPVKYARDYQALLGAIGAWPRYSISTTVPGMALSLFLSEVRQELRQASADRHIRGMTVVILYDVDNTEPPPAQAALPPTPTT